jgi:hypothetical protein
MNKFCGKIHERMVYNNIYNTNFLWGLIMKRITASGVRGVIWDKIKNRWVTYLWIDGKNKYIGSFHNMEDAIQAKIKVVEEYGKPELLEPYKYISVNERSKIYYNKDKEKNTIKIGRGIY